MVLTRAPKNIAEVHERGLKVPILKYLPNMASKARFPNYGGYYIGTPSTSRIPTGMAQVIILPDRWSPDQTTLALEFGEKEKNILGDISFLWSFTA